MNTYTTISGDTWDLIAFKVYGAEQFASYLMQNNYKFLDILVFDSGVVLSVPELLAVVEDEELPSWRTEAELEEENDPYDDYSIEEEDTDEGEYV